MLQLSEDRNTLRIIGKVADEIRVRAGLYAIHNTLVAAPESSASVQLGLREESDRIPDLHDSERVFDEDGKPEFVSLPQPRPTQPPLPRR